MKTAPNKISISNSRERITINTYFISIFPLKHYFTFFIFNLN